MRFVEMRTGALRKSGLGFASAGIEACAAPEGSNMELTFPITSYRCAKGHIWNSVGVSLKGFGERLDGEFCAICYAEHINTILSRVEAVPHEDLNLGTT